MSKKKTEGHKVSPTESLNELMSARLDVVKQPFVPRSEEEVRVLEELSNVSYDDRREAFFLAAMTRMMDNARRMEFINPNAGDDWRTLRRAITASKPAQVDVLPLTLDLAKSYRDLSSVEGDRDTSYLRMLLTFISILTFPISYSVTVCKIVTPETAHLPKRHRKYETSRIDGKHIMTLLCLVPQLIREEETLTVNTFTFDDPDPRLTKAIARLAYIRHNSPSSVKKKKEIVSTGASLDPRVKKAGMTSDMQKAITSALGVVADHKSRPSMTPDESASLFTGRGIDFGLVAAFLSKGGDSVRCKAIKKRDSLACLYATWDLDDEATLAYGLELRDQVDMKGHPIHSDSPVGRLTAFILNHTVSDGATKRDNKGKKSNTVGRNAAGIKLVTWDHYVKKWRGAWKNWCVTLGTVNSLNASTATMPLRDMPLPSAARSAVVNRPVLREILDYIYNGDFHNADLVLDAVREQHT